MAKPIPPLRYIIDGRREPEEQYQERLAKWEADQKLKKPILASLFMRIPEETRKELVKASARQGITMSKVVLLGLERILPELLAAPPRSWGE